MSYKELLLGCGSKREKNPSLPTAREIRLTLENPSQSKLFASPRLGLEFKNLVTLDFNPCHKPDILFDLSKIGGYVTARIHLHDDVYDEIHAYEVLEHIGQQGDYRTFFAQFSEFWRILKPDGLFFATCPSWCSPWAWGDPSHTRVITSGTLAFLSQNEYRRQVGVTPMSDFRFCYKADFQTIWCEEDSESLRFVLRAKK